MLVTPARRTRPIACAAHKVQNSALEVYFTPGNAPWCSEMWQCASIRPGRMNLPAASMTRVVRALRPEPVIGGAEMGDPVTLDNNERVQDRIAPAPVD